MKEHEMNLFQVSARKCKILEQVIKVTQGIIEHMPGDHPAVASLVRGRNYIEDGLTTIREGLS